MTDPFANTQPSLSGPAASAVSVTPSDGGDLAQPSRALYVAAAGNLAVRMLTGEAATFASVPAGSLLPIRVTRVLATGTTATGIVALF